MIKLLKNEVQRIWGSLDYEDDEHKEIQVVFYKKEGFDVREDQNVIELNF